MVKLQRAEPTLNIDVAALSGGEREELVKLSATSGGGIPVPYVPPSHAQLRTPLARQAISAPSVLNKAFAYDRPSSFTRALSFETGDVTVLLVSGTASVDESGETIHVGDFRAQCWRAYRNISTGWGSIRSRQARVSRRASAGMICWSRSRQSQSPGERRDPELMPK